VSDAVASPTYNGFFEFNDGADQAVEYEYDANGNMTRDRNKGISSIQYNADNLPLRIQYDNGSTEVTLADNSYDTLGRLSNTGRGGNGMLSTAYTYLTPVSFSGEGYEGAFVYKPIKNPLLKVAYLLEPLVYDGGGRAKWKCNTDGRIIDVAPITGMAPTFGTRKGFWGGKQKWDMLKGICLEIMTDKTSKWKVWQKSII